MKNFMLAMVVLLSGVPAFAQNTSAILNNYINVKNALVKGDSKAASESINKFYQGVKSEGNFVQRADLLSTADKLSKTGNNLEKQRSAFAEVSTIMWKLVKDSDKVTQSVYYEYCPMKKTYWLSLEKEIKNPYYGSSMLNCGKVTETKGEGSI